MLHGEGLNHDINQEENKYKEMHYSNLSICKFDDTSKNNSSLSNSSLLSGMRLLKSTILLNPILSLHIHPPFPISTETCRPNNNALAPSSVQYTAYFPHMAYFDVHSRAVLSCLARSVFKSWAISGTRGSSGLGSVNKEQILSNTLLIVSAGLH